MQTTIQPFVNLANANIAVFTRFAKSPEVAELTQDATQQVLALTHDSLNKVSGTKAFAEWTRALVDNYARFTEEYTKTLYGMAARSQAFLSSQVEQGARRLGQLSDVADKVTERSTGLLKSSTEQGANAVRNLADRGAEAVKQTADKAERGAKSAADDAADDIERVQKTVADRGTDAVKQATDDVARATKGAVDKAAGDVEKAAKEYRHSK